MVLVLKVGAVRLGYYWALSLDIHLPKDLMFYTFWI